jgi:hypothetical protein
MVKLIGIAAAAIMALAPAARAGEPKQDGRAAAAVELSRTVLTQETWDRTLKAANAQTAEQLVAMVQRSGGTVAPEFAAAFEAEFSKMVPYQEIVDLQAGLLAKHYTEAEIRQLLAFYKTPIGQKMIRVMPEVTADVTAWSMSIMQQRMAGVMERLAPLIRAQGAEGGTSSAK